MNNKLKQFSTWVPLIVAAAFIAGLWIGGSMKRVRPVSNPDGPERVEKIDAQTKLEMIMQYIANDYVDNIDTDSLLEAILPELLSSLDPHSVYIPAADFMAVNSELEGSFSGIGISFNTLTDTITVLEVISGGPAEDVGIMPGDRIVTIDDSVAAGRGWSNDKIITRLRGPEGTKVKVGVKRNSSPNLLDFVITRGEIPVTSIDAAYMLNPTTGYIKVNKFGRTTYQEFITEATALKEKGAKKLMVDLRGNGGGYMEMAILMANEFLPAGAPIVSTKGREKGSDSATAADGSGSLQQMELAVLIDEFSASASEIFAGAIQDNDRGLVVGRRSFGKGLVQRQMVLPDSSAIRLTIARYYTPSGRSIQKRYEHGGTKAYQEDLINRYDRGEFLSADSIKLDTSITFSTLGGRPVYGGGGIMPDIFVGNDTTGMTSYYMSVLDKGILQRFAFDYNDRNREQLNGASNVSQLLTRLPADDALLEQLAEYAEAEGVPQRWYYINISRDLLVNQLKALIARNALGIHAYYEVDNTSDPLVREALKAFAAGKARFPIK